jgi:ABC-type glutathione transport system ATPase component
METAARHANRVIVMRSGRLVAYGETDAVLSDWKTLANASVRLTEMQHFVRKQTLRSLNIVEIATVSP